MGPPVPYCFHKVVCPAGFRDIGVGEPSRPDSIDNTHYFYQQKVGIDHTTSRAILTGSKIIKFKISKPGFPVRSDVGFQPDWAAGGAPGQVDHALKPKN